MISRPPIIAIWLLAQLLPRSDRAAIISDLEELFGYRLIKAGRFRARLWFWSLIWSFSMRLLIDRFSSGGVRRQGATGGHQTSARTAGGVTSSVIQDVRYAIRSFLRSPGIALVAILTLALGIGATTSMFSVVNGIVLRPLPFPDSKNLVRLFTTEGADGFSGHRTTLSHAGANFIDVKLQNVSFEHLAAFTTGRYNIAGTGVPRVVRGAIVTPDFFAVLGVNAAVGRTLSADVDLPGGDRAVVLSHAFWQSEFAGDTGVLGASLTVDGNPCTVVGVMDEGFGYPGPTRFWVESRYRVPEPPADFGSDPSGDRGVQYFHAVGRLHEGVTLTEAQAEMTAIAARLEEAYPVVNANEGLNVVPLHESVVGNFRSRLYVLLGAVGFVLLIACANVASLLLVRASEREKEIVVRTALGAGRLRIVRQLLTECAVLAFCGGAAGVLVAIWGTQALLSLVPDGIPRVAEVGVDSRVLVFALTATLCTGLLFGLAPAIQSFKRDTRAATAAYGGRQTASQSRSRFRSALIIGEVAVSLMLLVGAGLTLRTYLVLHSVDAGFEPQQVLTMRIELPANKYPSDEEQGRFYQEVVERVGTLPGVSSAAGVLSLPVNAAINADFLFTIESREPRPGEEPHGGYQIATPGYFQTLGIPLLRGRDFSAADNADAPGAAVINQTMADLYWEGDDPIGKRVTWNDPEDEDSWVTIVGIVGDTRHYGLDEPPRPEIFQPYSQVAMPYMTLAVRSEMDATALTHAVRNEVLEVDPVQPLYEIKKMESVLFDSLGSQRFNMYLLSAFALAAVTLASVGLYGVLSFSVAQRSNEIGIRMALGAAAAGVIGNVVRQGLVLALIGLAIGTAAAFGLTRLMASMIHGVSATDPITFIGGIVLLTALALLASWIPALRAAKVSPMEVLRVER